MSAGSFLLQITKISDVSCRPQSAAAPLIPHMLSCIQNFSTHTPPLPPTWDRFIPPWIPRCARCLPVRVFPPDPQEQRS